jgi:hypothetical protein
MRLGIGGVGIDEGGILAERGDGLIEEERSMLMMLLLEFERRVLQGMITYYAKILKNSTIKF